MSRLLSPLSYTPVKWRLGYPPEKVRVIPKKHPPGFSVQ